MNTTAGHVPLLNLLTPIPIRKILFRFWATRFTWRMKEKRVVQMGRTREKFLKKNHYKTTEMTGLLSLIYRHSVVASARLGCVLSAEWALQTVERVAQEPRFYTRRVERVSASLHATDLVIRAQFAQTNRALWLRPLLHHIIVIPDWAYLVQVLQSTDPFHRSSFREGYSHANGHEQEHRSQDER